jgi:predicted ester cyclase
MNMEQTARDFFDACETGRGWAGCSAYCHDGATFACQADALAEVSKLSDYTEWMKGLFGPVPDGRYELHGFGVDSARNTVVAAATFHGTNTGEGGPVAPTGRSVAGDYVYVMRFEGGKIAHMTKVWNDQQSLRQMGWG